MSSSDKSTTATDELSKQAKPFFDCKTDLEEIDHLIELAEDECNKLNDNGNESDDIVDEPADNADVQVTKELDSIMNQYKDYLAAKSLEMSDDGQAGEELSAVISPSLSEHLGLLLKGKSAQGESHRTEC